MRNIHNIEASVFRKGEYVGYGAGEVWHIRKTQFGGWKWAARIARSPDTATLYGDTLAQVSKQLEAYRVQS